MVRIAAALVILAGTACSGGQDSKSESPTDAPAATDDAVVTAEPEPEPVEVLPGFLTGNYAIWKQPTSDRKIPNPDGEGTVTNWMANLERGMELERVDLSGDEGEWSKIKIADKEGWILTERILTGEDLKLGVVVEETQKFKRPEVLALDIDKRIPAGALLIVGKTEGKFVEVNHPTGVYDSEIAWARTKDVMTDATEVEAAKVVTRILQLREKDADGAAQLEKLAREEFSSSKLLSLLDVVEEAEGEGEEGDAKE